MQIIFRKMLFCLVFILLLSNSLLAQIDTVWTKKIGGEGKNTGLCVEETHDGGFIILNTNRLTGEPRSIKLIKTNSEGVVLWEKSFNSDSHIWANSLVETSDSGFIVFGEYDGNQAWLAKTDKNGDSVWTRTYSASSDDGEVSGYNVIESEDGGYILLGTYADFEPECQLWIAKTDTNGNIEYEKKIQLLSLLDDPSLLLQKNDLGFLVIVSFDDPSGIEFIQLSQDFNYTYSEFTVSDPQGHPMSAYSSVSPSNDNRADSGAVITGARGGNLLVSRIEMGGYRRWSYENRFSSGMNSGSSIVRTDDGGYFVAGTAWEYQYPNLVLLKINHDGVEEWNSTFAGGEGIDVKITSDNGFIVCGRKDEKVWLLKLKAAPIVKIATDSIWIDDNWDGFASGTLDGSNSLSPNGFAITSYEWKMKGNIIGTNASLEFSIPTGDNIIELKVTDEKGLSATAEKVIKVCSFKFETEGAITSSISTTNDSIFYASSTDDQVYCFNSENQLKWNLATGGAIRSTTTIGPLNNIYVGSSDTRLYCFDSLANFKWDTPMGGVVLASPAITNDRTIYVGTENSRLYSVNGIDGSINWNYLTGGSITSSASLSNNGDIYFGSSDKKFYSIGRTGSLNWSYATNGSIHSSPAIDTVGRIYFGSTDGKMYSFNSDGSLNWSFQTNGPIFSSPVIDLRGNIYVGSGDSSLYAIDVNGNEIWKYNTSSSVNGNPSLTSGGNVIFGCDDGKIYSLSENGELNWSYKTDLSVESAPLITSNGRIYIGSSDKSIYGFIDPNESEGLYNHQWPTFQKDNERTGYQQTNITSISEIFEVIKEYKLMQNYPNPFNPSTMIYYSIPEHSQVMLKVFDVLGSEVAELVNKELPAGIYEVQFDASDLRSGIYFYQMRTGSFVETKKMLLIK